LQQGDFAFGLVLWNLTEDIFGELALEFSE